MKQDKAKGVDNC